MRTINKCWIMILCLLMLAGIQLPVLAEDSVSGIEVNVPIDVVYDGSGSIGKGVLLKISPVDGSPAPKQTSLTVKTSKQVSFGQIDLPRVGIYVYRLQAENLDPSKMNLDGISDFRVEITVQNKDNAPGELISYIVASDWAHPANTEPKVPIEIHLSPKQTSQQVSPSGSNPGSSPRQPSGSNSSVNTADQTPSIKIWMELGAGCLLLLLALWIVRRPKKSRHK